MSDEHIVEVQDTVVEKTSKSIIPQDVMAAMRAKPADEIRNLIDATIKVGKKVDIDRLFFLAELNQLVLPTFVSADRTRIGFAGRLSMTISTMLRNKVKKGEAIYGDYEGQTISYQAPQVAQ